MTWMITSTPYRRPCAVLTALDNDKPCGKPSGSHTALELPICDDCWEAVQLLPEKEQAA